MAGKPQGAARTALAPAARRSDPPLTAIEAELNMEAIEVFAAQVGGRSELADTLAVAGAGADVERLATLLLDPRYRGWGLSRICHYAGLTIADLFTAYRKALIAKAHIESSHIIAAKLPPIVRDVMEKALPHEIPCDVCDGRSPTGCWRCRGTGRILSEPSVERHKLALELGQLLDKKGGLVVQQNTFAATVSATSAGSLEQLQQAVGDVLFGGAPTGPSRRDVPADVVRDLPAELPDGLGDEDEPARPFDDPGEPEPARGDPPAADD